MSDYELETMKQIWNNRHGMHLDIGPDRDCLDLLEIRQYEMIGGKDKMGSSVLMSWEEADLLQQALKQLLEEREHGKEEEKGR